MTSWRKLISSPFAGDGRNQPPRMKLASIQRIYRIAEFVGMFLTFYQWVVEKTGDCPSNLDPPSSILNPPSSILNLRSSFYSLFPFPHARMLLPVVYSLFS